MTSILSRLRLVAVLSLVAGALTVVGAGLLSAPADAVQATAGSAKYKAIEWISWGQRAGEEIPNAGRTVTERSTIAGKELAVTCTVSNIQHPAGSGTGALLQAYRSGSWQGDGFDDLYNRGGTGGDNQMVVGLANRQVANTVTFSFTCSATLDGQAMPLAGLVMADAESSAGNVEHVGATIPRTNPQTGEPTRWRILDRVRSATCADSATARRSETGTAASGTNRLDLYGPASSRCESSGATSPSPSVVAFMENASSATEVTVAGGGRSAIALGVALDLDFGDAPASYGDAVAATQLAYTSSDIPVAQGTFPSNRGVDLFDGFGLATVTPPTPRLGAATDGELSQPYSADATGDDAQPAAGPDDEDSVSLPSQVVMAPGGTFTTDVACTRSGALGGKVAGWIDWNLDGAFQDGERSTGTPDCPASGSVRLSWDLPADPLPQGGVQSTFLRLRIVGAGDRLQPEGISNAGEVEDHQLRVTTAPRLEVVKKVEGRTARGDQFVVDATGTGLDAGEIRATTSGAQNTASSERRRVATGTRYAISDAMAPGSPNSISDYVTAISCVDLAANNAPVAATGSGPRWQLAELNDGQIVRCTVINTAKPAALNVAKEAVEVTGPTAEGVFTARYRVTVSNSGPQAASYDLADTPQFAENLTVLEGSWRRDDAAEQRATGAGPFTLASGQRIERESTHVYRLDVAFRYADGAAASSCGGPGAGLFNRVALGVDQESGPRDDNTACLPPPAVPTSALALDKQAGEILDLDGNGADAGDRIDYRFVVTNTGELTLRELTVDDDRVTGLDCPTRTLMPGASTTCTGHRILTQTDVDAGSVENTATATGSDPQGEPVPSPEDSTSTPIGQRAELLLDKRAAAPTDLNENGTIEPGDTIAYTFVVTNTGTTTVTAVEVIDTLVDQVTCPVRELAPGESTTCAATPYVITQDDMDAGTVQNVALASGKAPTGTVESNRDDTSTNLTTRASLALEKRAGTPNDVNGSGLTDVGDTIAYSFTVTNTGTVRLSGVAVQDPVLTDAGATITCVRTDLAPGESTECTPSQDHVVTADDVAAGQVVNVATSSARNRAGGPVDSNQDETRTPTDRVAALVLAKDAELVDANSNGLAEVGETVRYLFTVTNAGAVPVVDLRIADDMLAKARVAITCAAEELAPGASTTCSASYPVRAADIGKDLINVATAHGEASTGPVVSDQDDAVVPTAGVLPHQENGVDGGTDGGDDGGSPLTGVLPSTGGFASAWVTVGVGLVGAGLLFVLGGRRRTARRGTNALQ
ncbi:CshA/CshB family fibrillar adhesin-related protein [Nocardioides sp. Bht2]|uniref:CshA/CshB family fibrillar adhesin-related protein n=1 Tax=Nocardioides sp. Bht2 TaxID=3392297 RepID=UPI0039B6149B